MTIYIYITGTKTGATVTFTLKKLDAKWYLDVMTKQGKVLVGTYKTKALAEQTIEALVNRA